MHSHAAQQAAGADRRMNDLGSGRTRRRKRGEKGLEMDAAKLPRFSAIR